MFIVYFLFSFCFAWSSTLTILTPKSWMVRQQFLGFDYVVIDKNEGINSLMIQKTSHSALEGPLQEALKKMIFNKKLSHKSPWSEIKIVDEFSLNFGEKKSGNMFAVEHLKDQIPFTSLVGAYPLEKDYYFIYYSDLRENYSRKKNQILKIIKNIKIRK